MGTIFESHQIPDNTTHTEEIHSNPSAADETPISDGNTLSTLPSISNGIKTMAFDKSVRAAGDALARFAIRLDLRLAVLGTNDEWDNEAESFASTEQGLLPLLEVTEALLQ